MIKRSTLKQPQNDCMVMQEFLQRKLERHSTWSDIVPSDPKWKKDHVRLLYSVQRVCYLASFVHIFEEGLRW